MSKKIRPGGAQTPLLGSKIQVKIEKLAIGGAGIARHEGLVIFVPLSAPQDELLVEITHAKKNFAEAKILEIITPSLNRRIAPCQVASICGGCNWQHLDEPTQQLQKQILVEETIRKFNPGLDFEYLSLKPSPRSLRYRNRIQPKFRNGKFGFFARNSHDIVDVSDCLITEQELTQEFPKVKNWIQNQNPKGLQKLEMYLDEKSEVRFGLITDEDDGVGFSQVNRFQNIDLLETALSWSGTDNYKNIYDLYAGSGNFTFPFVERFPESPMTAIELNEKLVVRARTKIQDRKVEFIQSDVEKYMSRTDIGPGDLVILDPPRAGASEFIMSTLAKKKPKKIIYISCHPVSLARDLKWFFAAAENQGISAQLVRIQAFEMFPQTDHVETIAELRVDS